MNIKSNEFYTPDQVADFLQVGYRNILQLIHTKKIRAIKIGNVYRISGYYLNKYLSDNIIN